MRAFGFVLGLALIGGAAALVIVLALTLLYVAVEVAVDWFGLPEPLATVIVVGMVVGMVAAVFAYPHREEPMTKSKWRGE